MKDASHTIHARHTTVAGIRRYVYSKEGADLCFWALLCLASRVTRLAVPYCARYDLAWRWVLPSAFDRANQSVGSPLTNYLQRFGPGHYVGECSVDCGIYTANQIKQKPDTRSKLQTALAPPLHALKPGTLGGQTLCSSEVRRRTTQILAFWSAASRNLVGAQDGNPI